MRNVMEGASLFTKGALDMGEPLTTIIQGLSNQGM